MDEAAQCLIDLNEHECIIGRTGPVWIGVYSKRCEISKGKDTPELALKISQYFYDCVVGLCHFENEFKLWLCQKGTLVEQHPRTGAKLEEEPKILFLALSPDAHKQIDTALWKRKPPGAPGVPGKKGDDLIVQAYQDMAEMQLMSQDQRRKFAQKYTKSLTTPAQKLGGLCKAIGINQHDLNYSDLQDLPDNDPFAKEMGLRRV